ncbi:MAG: MFS transporter [Chloroflexota bacterium]
MDNRLTNTLGLSGYIFIGTAAVLIPSIMPSITAEFTALGLTITTISLIFPARAIGGMLGNLVSGIGSDLYGRQKLVWLSALILALSLAVTALARPWIFFVGGFVLVSAAQGALSTGINALIADANQDARAKMLNILHGIYGVGAAISPLVIGGLIDWGLPWRWALGGVGLIWLIYAVVVYSFDNQSRHSQRSSPQEDGGLAWQMLTAPPFIGLFLIAFIYNGVAWSLLGWIAVFMKESRDASIFVSVSAISIFYTALTIGRFVCAFYAEKLGYARTLVILSVGITVTYPLVILGGNTALVIIGVFLTGLGFSGLFPTAMAYGARLYPKQTGAVSGTLSVAMTIGSMIPPLWTGIIADWWSFQSAMAFNYVLVPPLIIIALYLKHIEKPHT